MQLVLQDLIGNGVEVYLNVIVVDTKTEEEHVALLSRVLIKFESENIRLRRSKCHFFVKEIVYLGFFLSNSIVKPSERKLDSVRKYPRPTSVRQVQSFVGLANYFRNLIPDLSTIVGPLTRLTKKNASFEWTGDQEIAFVEIKRILTSEPVLAVFDPTLDIELSTDASKEGLAGILSQKDAKGNLSVIAYWSRRLKDHIRHNVSLYLVIKLVKTIYYVTHVCNKKCIIK